MKQVVVTGSIAFDRVMSFPGRFRDQIDARKLHILNVSFLVDKLSVERGGTGGNIAYNLAMLGEKPRLVAAVGRDAKEYINQLEGSGVDVSGIKTFKERTAVGTAVTDKEDNQIWAFYQGAMKRSSTLSISSTAGVVFVVIAPNDPRAVVGYVSECIKRKIDYMYDPAFQISHYSKSQLKKAVGGAKIVVGNDYEIALIRKRLGASGQRLVRDKQILITTLGSKGSVIEQGGKRYKIPVARPKNTSDPTGAGDAYRAGFLAGYFRELPLGICGRMGAVTAAYTVEKYGTQTHKFTKREFKQRYKDNFGKELKIS